MTPRGVPVGTPASGSNRMEEERCLKTGVDGPAAGQPEAGGGGGEGRAPPDQQTGLRDEQLQGPGEESQPRPPPPRLPPPVGPRGAEPRTGRASRHTGIRRCPDCTATFSLGHAAALEAWT